MVMGTDFGEMFVSSGTNKQALGLEVKREVVIGD